MTFKGGDVQVAEIMSAIRARIRRRRLTLDTSAQDQITESIDKLARSAGLSGEVSQAEMKAMLEGKAGWNIDGPFPIASHRPVLGPFIILVKKALRYCVRLLARPVIVQQAEINRRQIALTREVALELARQNSELISTVMRLEAVLRRTGIDTDTSYPLVLFDDSGDGQNARRKRPRPRPRRSRPRGARGGRGAESGEKK